MTEIPDPTCQQEHRVRDRRQDLKISRAVNRLFVYSRAMRVPVSVERLRQLGISEATAAGLAELKFERRLKRR